MSSSSEIAAALYGATAPAPTSAPATPVAQPQREAPQPLASVQDADVPPASDRSEVAASLFDGGPGLTASEADAVLQAGFSAVELEAAERGDPQEIEDIREGRQQAASLAEELGVGRSDMNALSVGMAEFANREYLTDEQVEAGNAACEKVLRAKWGNQFDQNLADAKRAFQHAAQKLWWLRELDQRGAGISPEIVAKFSVIGARMRKAARR